MSCANGNVANKTARGDVKLAEPAAKRQKTYVEVNGEKYTPTVKAYKNMAFINGNHARPIRILCEYEETKERLEKENIEATVLFFASARAKHPEVHARLTKEAEAKVAAAKEGSPEHAKAVASLKRINRTKWMCKMYEQTRSLARRLAKWGIDRVSKGKKRVSVCSGGGPGLMEAANLGASEVPGAKSIGMGISLPFEAGLNPYVSTELAFEYHYFFTRKYWMANRCHALIASPGGFGTCDELFEILTLMQTKKHPTIPIVLFSKKFWNTVFNWDALVEFGTVSPNDVKQLFITDSVDEAFDYVTNFLDGMGKEE